ncbi:MAG: lytic transglycosylase domain-containing protein [Armatimonadetes bacterium]|nr:lytic transglycosylase domain-containing protein [Armatimonadota bacterium]
MKNCIVLSVALWLACSLIWAADAPLKDNAREYLALRATLQAPTLTAAQLSGPRSPWRGKTVELYGRVVGRTNACAAKNTPTTLMLQFPGVRELVLLDATGDQPLAAIDNVVHVLAQLPANAKPTDRFAMRAVILETDLPPNEQRYLADTADNPLPVASGLGQQVAGATPSKDAKEASDAQQTPTAPTPPNPPQQTVSRPGSQMPVAQLKGVSNNTIGVWKQWVGKINPKLNDAQLELIVRSVIYYSALYGIDHRLSFSMIKCESDFDPRCLSHAGASGLCQLMPGTAAGLGVDRWDIEQNINGGLKYLAEQLRAYANRSNYDQFALALASYNAGPNAVKRAGGVPNIPETVRYVKKVGDLFVQLHKTMP